MKTKIMMLGVAFLAIGLMANAQSASQGQRMNQNNQKGMSYVDNDKDGNCDNLGNRNGVSGKGQGTCNIQGQGVRNGKGTGNANCEPGGQGKRNPNCVADGQGKGNGQCGNFTDANKNGVCDRLEKTPQNK